MDAGTGGPSFGVDADFCRAVRSEILAGRPVIAVHARRLLSPEVMHALVEDAATVSGRRSDLRIIDLDIPVGNRTQYLHPQARSLRIPAKVPARRPDILRACVEVVFRLPENREMRPDHRTVNPWRNRGAVDERGTNCLPPFDPSEFAAGSPLLVVMGIPKALPRTLAWLLEGAFLAGASPLVVSESFDLGRLAAATDRHLRYRHGFSEHHRFALMGNERQVALAEREEDTAGWLTASAAFDAGLHVDMVRGMATIERDGRKVVVAGFADAKGNGTVLAGERDRPGGYVNLDQCVSDDLATEADVTWLARRIWRAGNDVASALMTTGREGFGPRASLRRYAMLSYEAIDSLRTHESEGRLGPGFADALMTPDVRRVMEDCRFAREPGRVFTWASQQGKEHRRRQFLSAMPAFAAAALAPEVSDAVDAGETVVPLLAAWLGLPPSMVRRVARRSALPTFRPVSFSRARDDMLTWGTGVLAALGPDRVPAATEPDAAWQALLSCVDLTRFNLDGASLPPEVAASLLARTKGAWPAKAAALAMVRDGETREVGDMVAGLAQLIACHIAEQDRDAATVASARILAEGRSLPAMYEASRQWHRHPVLARTSGLMDPDASWPVPFDMADLGDGWTATCLEDVASLVADGSSGPDASGMPGMGHCVATYAAACYEGTSVIVSLRLTEGGVTRRMSTVELTPGGRLNPWDCDMRPAVKQHHGRGNSQPDPGAMAALARLRTRVEDGTVPMRQRDTARVEIQQARRLALAEERLRLWEPLLPRRWAGLDLAGMCALLRREGHIPQEAAPAG